MRKYSELRNRRGYNKGDNGINKNKNKRQKNEARENKRERSLETTKKAMKGKYDFYTRKH